MSLNIAERTMIEAVIKGRMGVATKDPILNQAVYNYLTGVAHPKSPYFTEIKDVYQYLASDSVWVSEVLQMTDKGMERGVELNEAYGCGLNYLSELHTYLESFTVRELGFDKLGCTCDGSKCSLASIEHLKSFYDDKEPVTAGNF
ncbi:hypothetical protein [Vibrio phage VCPH]|nr:hypothetical protein [Vibrio phage VCPH]